MRADERRMELTLPGLPSGLRLTLTEPKEWHERRGELVARAGGFGTEREAMVAGQAVKNALRLAGPALAIGIDVGADTILSAAPRRADGIDDPSLQPCVHGLQVHPDIEIFGVRLEAGPSKWPLRPNDFQRALLEHHSLGFDLTDKQIVSMRLYAQAHLESSELAQFLTLVMVVEALAAPAPKSGRASALIDRMLRLAEPGPDTADVPEEELVGLRHALGNLRQQSVSAACRGLVQSFLGSAAAKRFGTAYRLRGEILHSGRVPPVEALEQQVQSLDLLVRHLLMRQVVRGWKATPLSFQRPPTEAPPS